MASLSGTTKENPIVIPDTPSSDDEDMEISREQYLNRVAQNNNNSNNEHKNEKIIADYKSMTYIKFKDIKGNAQHTKKLIAENNNAQTWTSVEYIKVFAYQDDNARALLSLICNPSKTGVIVRYESTVNKVNRGGWYQDKPNAMTIDNQDQQEQQVGLCWPDYTRISPREDMIWACKYPLKESERYSYECKVYYTSARDSNHAPRADPEPEFYDSNNPFSDPGVGEFTEKPELFTFYVYDGYVSIDKSVPKVEITGKTEEQIATEKQHIYDTITHPARFRARNILWRLLSEDGNIFWGHPLKDVLDPVLNVTQKAVMTPTLNRQFFLEYDDVLRILGDVCGTGFKLQMEQYLQEKYDEHKQHDAAHSESLQQGLEEIEASSDVDMDDAPENSGDRWEVDSHATEPVHHDASIDDQPDTDMQGGYNSDDTVAYPNINVDVPAHADIH